ncbi:gluconokinase, partial [Acidipropionibacterium jensenii]|uniref:gluconokinase n=1 Tax=Acidipropionibacterium jensenii TaxID=1749 RepID=UPI0034513B38
MAAPGVPPLVVVMGVSGSGKSALGTRLAARLDLAFVDGDDLHPARNIAKMAAGHPLDDADREPWLQIIGRWLEDHRDRGGVVACSALRRSYRDLIREHCPEVVFLHLAGNRDLIVERVAARSHHFMPASLVDSQFATLEPLGPDEAGTTLDIARTIPDLVVEAAHWLARSRPTAPPRGGAAHKPPPSGGPSPPPP